MTPAELHNKVVQIPFAKLLLIYERYLYEISRREVHNADIKEYLRIAGGYVSVAQIMQALKYHNDDTTNVCARMRCLEKRKNQKVESKVINGVKHYRLNRS